MLIDPVCGKRIKRQRAHIAIDYGGVTYYLCCPRCQADFEREPYKFARPEWGENVKWHPKPGKTDRRTGQPMSSGNIVRGVR
jgi:YHS domain-containing protein